MCWMVSMGYVITSLTWILTDARDIYFCTFMQIFIWIKFQQKQNLSHKMYLKLSNQNYNEIIYTVNISTED